MISIHQSGKAAGALAGLFLTLCCVVAFIPLAPVFPDGSLDGSWTFALNAAVANGMIFGKDIVFTFGPYASSYTELYHPATDGRMLWSSALFALAFSTGLIRLATGWRRLLAMPLAGVMVLMPRDTLFLALPFLFLKTSCSIADEPPCRTMFHVQRQSTLTLGAFIAALALLPLVKGTFGVATGVSLALGFAAVWPRRRILACLGSLLFVVLLPTFWWLAGQPITSLPGFFLSLLPVMSGYTEAMSMEGPGYQAGLYLVGCATLLVLGSLRLSNTGRPGLLLLLGTALFLFLAFKEGFVRQDGHVLIAAWFLFFVSSIWLLSQNTGVACISLIACLAASLLLSGNALESSAATLSARLKTPFLKAYDALVLRNSHPEAMSARFDASLAAIRAERPLPRLDGTVDIYPTDQSDVLAHGLTWAPRPDLQSYSAYTLDLALLDAAHLTGQTAPDNVVFSIQPFGDRLPSQDDGASWPILLSNYSPSGFGAQALFLRHTTGPVAPIHFVPLSDRVYHLDEEIGLPPGKSPLWADFNVTRTLFGKILSILYKPPVLHIEFRFADGSVKRFRYLAATGQGFLISPIVESTWDFLALRVQDGQDHFAGRRPVSVAISADQGAGWLWRNMYRARIMSFSLSADERAGRLLPNPVFIQAESRASLPTTDDCSIDRINTRSLPPGIPQLDQHIRVDGWGAISAQHGVTGTEVSLTLTADNGEVRSLPARRMARPDVNAFFKRPDSESMGFIAEGEFSVPAGDYSLGVDVSLGGQTWRCTHKTRVHLAAG